MSSDAYYEVLLATKQLEVAEQAAENCRSPSWIAARRDSTVGLAVESDLLTAKVRMAARQQELIRARNNLDLARAELNTAMGVPVDLRSRPTEALAERTLPVPVLAGSRETGTHESAGPEAHCNPKKRPSSRA